MTTSVQMITSVTSNNLVITQDGALWTTSLLVAEKFEKEHSSVLRAIKEAHCSQAFTDANFAVSTYKDSSGRELPMYLMTQKGFSWIALGFTGERAAVWKEAFLDAFDKMSQPKSTLEMLVMSIQVAQEHEARLKAQDQKINKAESRIEAIEAKLVNERINEFPEGCDSLSNIAEKFFPNMNPAVISNWLHINDHSMSEYKRTTPDNEVRTTAVYRTQGLTELRDKLARESTFIKTTDKNHIYQHPKIAGRFYIKNVSHQKPFIGTGV